MFVKLCQIKIYNIPIISEIYTFLFFIKAPKTTPEQSTSQT